MRLIGACLLTAVAAAIVALTGHGSRSSAAAPAGLRPSVGAIDAEVPQLSAVA